MCNNKAQRDNLGAVWPVGSTVDEPTVHSHIGHCTNTRTTEATGTHCPMNERQFRISLLKLCILTFVAPGESLDIPYSRGHTRSAYE